MTASLDADEIERLLFECENNVTEIAKRLGVRSDRVRRFIASKPQLRQAQDEVLDMAADEAVAVLYKALRDEMSFQNRFYAAKEFLRSDAGRRRGFGREVTQASLEVKAGASGRTIVMKWLDPDPARLEPPTIDGETQH